MGASYDYVNHSTKEYFSIGALGGGTGHRDVGRNLEARVLGLLLKGGRWAGDRIEIVGDTDPLWEKIVETYVDIAANAIETAFYHDRLKDLGPAAERDDPLFIRLGYLATTKQVQGLHAAMIEYFGKGYPKRFKETCENYPIRIKYLDLAPDRPRFAPRGQ